MCCLSIHVRVILKMVLDGGEIFGRMCQASAVWESYSFEDLLKQQALFVPTSPDGVKATLKLSRPRQLEEIICSAFNSNLVSTSSIMTYIYLYNIKLSTSTLYMYCTGIIF